MSVVILATVHCDAYGCRNEAQAGISVEMDERDIPIFDVSEPAGWRVRLERPRRKDADRCLCPEHNR